MISKTAPNTRVQGFRRGIGHPRSPSEVIKHLYHAPLTPRSTQPTGLFKRTSEHTGAFPRKIEEQKAKLSAITGWVFRFRREGGAAAIRVL